MYPYANENFSPATLVSSDEDQRFQDDKMYPFERKTPLANAPHLHTHGTRQGGNNGAAVREVDLRGYDVRSTFTVDVSRKICLRRFQYP